MEADEREEYLAREALAAVDSYHQAPHMHPHMYHMWWTPTTRPPHIPSTTPIHLIGTSPEHHLVGTTNLL